MKEDTSENSQEIQDVVEDPNELKLIGFLERFDSLLGKYKSRKNTVEGYDYE